MFINYFDFVSGVKNPVLGFKTVLSPKYTNA